MNLSWSPNTDRLVEPEWLGALPRPDGGVFARFDDEPVPLSNGRCRRDVSIGDSTGEVLIGDASSNDVDLLQVVWPLTRGAP